jgi:hypothetical protein
MGPLRSILGPILLSVRAEGDANPRPPTLILNPRQDTEFVGRVTDLVGDEHWTPERLQAALRDRYPLSRVHRRELSGEFQVVLYVYRDGHWIPE